MQIDLFSTCPPSSFPHPRSYTERVIESALLAEAAGHLGILVYSDNSLIDPWLIAHLMIQSTAGLCPLIAVQPVYMHPYTVAKAVTSIAFLHHRRVFLNMVAGGFTNDLQSLNDNTCHDRRYDRLIEYTTIINLLLDGRSVTYKGEFYSVTNLKLSPPLPAELRPGIFMSGSSSAGIAAAKATRATAIMYPKPWRELLDEKTAAIDCGIRIGVICRSRKEEAWEIAHARFPEDRCGQLTHKLAMKVSDSEWHRQLSDWTSPPAQTPYWLVPFENYKTMCPYLVGSYDQVAQELEGYLCLGYRTFILDVPIDAAELGHITTVFAMARSRCRNYFKAG